MCFVSASCARGAFNGSDVCIMGSQHCDTLKKFNLGYVCPTVLEGIPFSLFL